MANDGLMGSLNACRGGNEELKVPPLFCSLPEHHFLQGGNLRTGRMVHVGLYHHLRGNDDTRRNLRNILNICYTKNTLYYHSTYLCLQNFI